MPPRLETSSPRLAAISSAFSNTKEQPIYEITHSHATGIRTYEVSTQDHALNLTDRLMDTNTDTKAAVHEAFAAGIARLPSSDHYSMSNRHGAIVTVRLA